MVENNNNNVFTSINWFGQLLKITLVMLQLQQPYNRENFGIIRKNTSISHCRICKFERFIQHGKPILKLLFRNDEWRDDQCGMPMGV